MTTIKKISGITKRFFLALQELANKEPDVEGVLFQLCSVIDSTAKLHFPNENGSKKRFIDYIDSYQEELLRLSYGFIIKIDGFKNPNNGKFYKLSEILYNIRCSNYHDPEELENIIDLDSELGKIGFDSIDINIAQGLFLLLWTDLKNKDRIKLEYFNKNTYKQFKLADLIGKRELLYKN